MCRRFGSEILTEISALLLPPWILSSKSGVDVHDDGRRVKLASLVDDDKFVDEVQLLGVIESSRLSRDVDDSERLGDDAAMSSPFLLLPCSL